MNLPERIDAACYWGEILRIDQPSYQASREKAYWENKWFIPEYSWRAGESLALNMLTKEILTKLSNAYAIPERQISPKTVGLIMAGNIPFVGFHDMLILFLSGHRQRIKTSSKDRILIGFLVDALHAKFPQTKELIQIDENLKGCDAYIATGTDNSARHFEYYFSKYPHIIRKNRTSVAILDGTETEKELSNLADDIQLYFGLGCRNITQIFVPQDYNFEALLHALKKYDSYLEHDRYKNNFDYQLTIAIMNNRFYMTNGSIVLIENENPFSPISQLHYRFYNPTEEISEMLDHSKIQCIVGKHHTPFGSAQSPGITDFPDGVDTLKFLLEL
jgi:hypothetical protein